MQSNNENPNPAEEEKKVEQPVEEGALEEQPQDLPENEQKDFAIFKRFLKE
jgi:hypothetical protein